MNASYNLVEGITLQATISHFLLGMETKKPLDKRTCSIAFLEAKSEEKSEPSDVIETKSFVDTVCTSTLSCSSPLHVGSAPSSAVVRQRFLTRLGFSPPIKEDCNFLSTTRAVLPIHMTSKDSFQIPLSECNNKPKSFHVCDTSNPLLSLLTSFMEKMDRRMERRTVHFAPLVTVHLIPSHTAYSSRVRETIWISIDEMKRNATRNCLEYAAENWNWQEVIQEEDMFYQKGELVHPVHVLNKCS